uniref:Extensin-like isoform X1 n=1 Tax=Petromyzon marinus TaxID=7757 RepID=A0AAJ7SU95_PETMA|nr:extensin-like isoform X1 [Petromyzon marinus]
MPYTQTITLCLNVASTGGASEVCCTNSLLKARASFAGNMAQPPTYSLVYPTANHPDQNMPSNANNQSQPSATTSAPYLPGTEMLYLSKTTFYQSASSAMSFPVRRSDYSVAPNSPVYTGTAYPASSSQPCHHLSGGTALAEDPSIKYIHSPGASGFAAGPSHLGFIGPDGMVAPPCGHVYPPPTGKVFPQHSAMYPPPKSAPLMAQVPNYFPDQAAWAFHAQHQQPPTEPPCPHSKMPQAPSAPFHPTSKNNSGVSGKHSAVSGKKPHPRTTSKQSPVRGSSTKALLSPMSPSATAVLQYGGRALCMAATGFRLIGKAKKYFSTTEAEHEAEEMAGQQVAAESWELSED